MKKTIILSLALYFTNALVSQNQVEKIGPKINDKKSQFFDEIVMQDESALYALRKNTIGKGLNYFLEKYSASDLTKIYSYPVLNIKAYEEQTTKTFIKNNRFYILSKQHNLDNKTVQYVLDTYSTTSGESIKKEIILEFPTNLDTWYKHSMTYVINPDTTKLLFVLRNSNEIILEEMILENYKRIGSKKIEQKSDDIVDYANYKLDSEDNVYLLRYYDHDQKTNKYNSLELNSYNFIKGGAELKVQIEAQTNTLLNNVDYSVIKNHNYIYVYSGIQETKAEKTDKSFKNKGLFVMQIDKKSFTKVNDKTVLFSEDIIRKLTCGKPKSLPESRYIPFMNFFDKDNMFIGLSCEWGVSSQREIIVYSLGADLNLNWERLIYRNLNTINSVTTFATTRVVYDNTLSFLFLEDPDFEEKKLDINTVDICSSLAAGNYSKKNIVSYSLNLKGNLTKKKLYFNDEQWLIPSPGKINSKNGKILVRFMNGKDESLGILNIK